LFESSNLQQIGCSAQPCFEDLCLSPFSPILRAKELICGGNAARYINHAPVRKLMLQPSTFRVKSSRIIAADLHAMAVMKFQWQLINCCEQ
jgi:hypothetical protein